MYCNVQSLLSNFCQIKILIAQYRPKLLFLSEVRITEDIEESEIKINGYELVNCCSSNRHTGGAAVYINSSIKYEVVSKTVLGQNWFVMIKIYKGMKSGLYSVLYHSPSESKKLFLNYFERWLEDFMDPRFPNIILGDFNIDVSKNRYYSKKLIDLYEFYGLRQIVTDYTRITNGSNSIIDLVLTNETDLITYMEDKANIADHRTIVIESITTRQEKVKNYEEIEVLDWKDYSKQKLINELNKFDFNTIKNISIHAKTEILCEKLSSAVNVLVKKKKIKIKDKNDWFVSELYILQHERNVAYNIATFTDTDEDWTKYRTIRNRYVKQCKLLYNKDIEETIEKYKKDSKELWKVLKKLMKKKDKQPDKVQFENGEESNEQIIAEKFNDFFISSIVKINDNIEASNVDPIESVGSYPDHTFEFEEIDLTYIKNIVKNMKNKASSDGVSVKVIEDAMEVIGGTLVDIINESLRTGQVPETWKTSVVIPIPKVPNTKKCEEFRPINMLSNLEKILEIVVKEQLVQYLDENNLLIAQQSGFRASHSCETALNLVLSSWKDSVQNNKVIVAVFLDLQRAFETIDRKVLLRKLERYGIKNAALRWFQNYLEGRTQATKFGKTTSTLAYNNLGVPQGASLSPILFTLFINDIVKIIKHSEINLFADDTLIAVAANSVEEAVTKINEDLKLVSEWLKANKLKLNIKKTKSMIVTLKKKININEIKIKIDDKEIEIVSEMKYLGVFIDNKLNFNKNVDYISKKIARKYGLLCRLNKKLTPACKITLYKSLISPHIDYCSSILFSATNEQFGKLQKLQNKIMRLIIGCNRYTRINDMLSTLGWLNVKQRVYFNTLVLIFKMKNHMLPNYLSEKLSYVRDMHDHNTRTRNNFVLPNYTKAVSQNSVFYKGIRLFNQMSDEMKNARTVKEFKRHCTRFVKEIN
jgi:hypothetical protein